LPAAVALHETAAVPNPATLVGVMVPQVSPDGTLSIRLTSPAKWFRAVTIIVEVAELPALTGAGEVAVIVKSRNWKVAVALWMRGVLVPLIVAV
jgi:hypothetical protein